MNVQQETDAGRSPLSRFGMVVVQGVGPDPLSSLEASELESGDAGARPDPLVPVGAGAKRALDLLAVVPALLFLSPLFLALAILIRLESPGPSLFRQQRGGFGGKPFTIFKFRTMRCEEDGDAVRQAVRGDNRITPLGAFLRRTSIDELPQLLNVLRGDMSLVGPRPHALTHDASFAAIVAGYSERFCGKPGLTGLAQINGWRGETDTHEKIVGRVENDVAYVRNWSLWLDVSIIWRTLMMIWRDPMAF